MLKVLIADDEIKICKLIMHLIPWEELSLEVIGTVNDGISALDEIKKSRPDILITDIRMPECDGLELIKQAKEINPEMGCIIISGHSDFSYAQQAIQNGADDYLLKPIKQSELIGSLKKIIAKTDQLIQAQHTKENLIKTSEIGTSKIRKLFLTDLLAKSADTINLEELRSSISITESDFKKDFFQTFAVQPIFSPIDETDKLRSFFISKIEAILSVIFDSFSLTISATYKGAVYCVLNDDEMNFAHALVRIGRIRKEIIALGASFKDVIITASKVLPGEKGFIQTVLEAELALSERYFEKSHEVIRFQLDIDEVIDCRRETVLDFEKNYRKALVYAIKKKNIASLSAILGEIKVQIEGKKCLRGISLQAAYQYLAELAATVIRKESLSSDAVKTQNELMALYFNLNDIESLFKYYIKYVELLNDQQITESDNDITPVSKAKDYVALHYSDSFSLDDIGAYVNLNPAYFSSIFKKETGMNFMDYVNSIRIENAIVFLKQTNKSLNEISESVGFNDVKYFSKRFKIITGLSPHDYRKLYC